MTTHRFLLTGLGGAATYAVGSMTWRASSRLSDNVSIHALGTLTPLFAVLILMATGQAGDVSPRLIIAAALILTVANATIAATGLTKRPAPEATPAQ